MNHWIARTAKWVPKQNTKKIMSLGRECVINQKSFMLSSHVRSGACHSSSGDSGETHKTEKSADAAPFNIRTEIDDRGFSVVVIAMVGRLR